MARKRRSAVAEREQTARPLTARQQRLVAVIVEAASRGTELTREEAGRLAGYGEGETARVAASRTLALPYVRSALIAATQEAAQGDVPAFYGTIRHIASKARSTRDRLGAARAGLEFAGVAGPPPTGGGVAIQIVFKSADAARLLEVPPVALAPPPRRDSSHMAED